MPLFRMSGLVTVKSRGDSPPADYRAEGTLSVEAPNKEKAVDLAEHRVFDWVNAPAGATVKVSVKVEKQLRAKAVTS